MAVSLWQCRFALYLARERESEAVAAAMVGVKVHEAIEATAQYARKRVNRRRKSNWFGVCIMKLLKSVQFELINAIDIDSRNPRICRIMKNRIIS